MNRIISEFKNGNSDKVFQDIKNLNDSADYSIVNFESAVTDESDEPITKCGPNLHCPKFAICEIRKAGFDMVTLANNHFYDFGESSIRKSFDAFQSCSLDWVGAGYNLEQASKTFYKQIKNKTIAIINCCEHEFSIATHEHGGCNPLNPIQQYYAIKEAKDKADYIIVIVHGGHEHFQLPSLRMKETYRFFVDAGADAVVNHHQHCYSGYEYYKKKPIFYGIGNFCFDFDIKKSDIWYEGYIVKLDFNEEGIIHKLYPYIQCKDEPKISLLQNRIDFDKKIDDLNKIISDDNLLADTVNNFYRSTDKMYKSVLEPYGNKYLNAAYSRGLLPSLFPDKKKTQVLNYLMCESHLDRFIESLKQ